MQRADLHIHSNYSDGSDSLSELVNNIKQAGTDIFALTDHDTNEGCIELAKNNIKFINGIELTCKLDNINCHILGYNYDLFDEGLKNLIAEGKELRRIKLEKRISYLKEVYNIVLTEDEKAWLYSRKSVVKTHLARILVNRRLAGTNLEAMQKYLDGCKTGSTKFDGHKAVNVLKRANGIVIWAHPLGGEGETHLTEEEFIPRLEIMIKAGIQGLECYYSRYNNEEINILLKHARINNLLITGGSDYHGNNKVGITLGKLNVNNEYISADKLTVLNLIKQ